MQITRNAQPVGSDGGFQIGVAWAVVPTPGLRSWRLVSQLLRFALVPLALALATPAFAEVDIIDPGTVQLTGWAGYAWGGSFSGDTNTTISPGGTTGTLNIASSPTYGGQLGLRVQADGFAFISFTHQATQGTVTFADGTPASRFDLDVGYLQIGGILDLPMNRHFVPFIGLSIGASYLKPQVQDASMQWSFAGSALAGAKIPITNHIGLMTQMRFLGAVVSSDTNFACVSNGGDVCNVRIGDTTGYIQGDVTGGVYISF